MSEQALGKSWKPITIDVNGHEQVVGCIRKPEWQLGTHEECPDCKRAEKEHAPLVRAWKRRYLK